MSAKRSPDNFHRPPIQRIGSSAFLFPAGGKQCFNVPLYFRVSGKLLFKSLLYFRTRVGGIRLCISQQTLNRRNSNTPEWNFSDIAGFLPLSVPCLQCLLFSLQLPVFLMQRSKFLLLLPAALPFENERSLKAFRLLLQICDGGYMRRNKLILIAAFQCDKVFHSKAQRLPAKATLKCGHISHARIERVWIESGFHMLFYRINQGLSSNIKG